MTCLKCGRDVTLLDHLCGHCTGDVWSEAPDIETFLMYRAEDESGVSGEGVVAVGVLFPSGKVEIEWLNDANPNVDTEGNGHASYDSLEDAREIHGHDGRTVFIL